MNLHNRILFKYCNKEDFYSDYHDSDIYFTTIFNAHTSDEHALIFKGVDGKYYMNKNYKRTIETYLPPTSKGILQRNEDTYYYNDNTTTTVNTKIDFHLLQGNYKINDKPAFHLSQMHDWSFIKPPMLFYNDDNKWTFGIPPYCKKYINNTKNSLFKWNPAWAYPSDLSNRYSSTLHDVSVYSCLKYKGIWTNNEDYGSFTVNYPTSDAVVDHWYYSNPNDDSTGVHSSTITHHPWTCDITRLTLNDFKNLPIDYSYLSVGVYTCDTLYGVYTNVHDANDQIPVGSKLYQLNFENTSGSFEMRNIVTDDLISKPIRQDYVYDSGIEISGSYVFFREKATSRNMLKTDFDVADGYYFPYEFPSPTGTITSNMFGHFEGWHWVGGQAPSGDAYLTLSGFVQPSGIETLMTYNTMTYGNISGDYSNFTPDLNNPDLSDCNYITYLHDQLAKQFIHYKSTLRYIAPYQYPNFYDLNEHSNLNNIPLKWNKKLKDDALINYRFLFKNSYDNTDPNNIVWYGGPAHNFNYDLSGNCSFEPVDIDHTISGWNTIDQKQYRFPIRMGNVSGSHEQDWFKNMINYTESIQWNVNDSRWRCDYDLNGILIRSIDDYYVWVEWEHNWIGFGNTLSEAKAEAEGEANKVTVHKSDGAGSIINFAEISDYGTPGIYRWMVGFKNNSYLAIFPDPFKMFGIGKYDNLIHLSFFEDIPSPLIDFGSFYQGEAENELFYNDQGLFTTENDDCFFGYAYPLDSANKTIFNHEQILYNANGEGKFRNQLNAVSLSHPNLVNPLFVTKTDITNLDSVF
jgi:hypothetical protein